MTGDKMQEQAGNDQAADTQSRREFVKMSTVAGIVAVTGSKSAVAAAVVEMDVEVKTPDGNCDAAFVYPAKGSHPGVLIWSDAFGLRPVLRSMARRLAAEGYAVLVPNPYYRTAKAPVFDDVSKFSFQNPDDRAKLTPLMGSLSAPGKIESDAKAYIAFLDAQKQVNRKKKIGTQGYCMGGPLVMKTAAAVPDRVGAGASFHGGGLVTDKPDSPHLLVPKIKAKMYFGIASNDDKTQPDAKDKLRAAFEAVHGVVEIEVYADALHGWCIADMPMANGSPIYNAADAERAWAKLLALYRNALG